MAGGDVTALIRGSELGARLGALHDEYPDTDGLNKIMDFTDQIVIALERIGAGRTALTGLLDHEDDGIRALAGTYLIDLMPDRVVPLLQNIEARRDGSNPCMRSGVALMGWQYQKISRFNSLTP